MRSDGRCSKPRSRWNASKRRAVRATISSNAFENVPLRIRFCERANVRPRDGARRGKSWKTPRESLLFTLALPYATQGDECVRLPIVVGISVAESLQRLGYPVALKWPNDLWLAGGKTGGILFEQLNGCAVIGIGINLDADPGVTTQGWPVRSLRDRGPLVRRRSAEAGRMLGVIVRDLLDALGAFPKTPVHCLPALWRSVDAFDNRSVRLCAPDGCSAVRGVVRGITEEGALCLETPDGMRTFRNGSLCPTEP